MPAACAKALRKGKAGSVQGAEEGHVVLVQSLWHKDPWEGLVGQTMQGFGNHIKNCVVYYQNKGSHRRVFTVNYITFSLLMYSLANLLPNRSIIP